MFLLTKPNQEMVERFLSEQRQREFSYPETGQSLTQPPQGYNIDRYRIKLGEGEQVYRRAVQAVKEWKMFDIGWLKIVDVSTPIVEGECVTIVASHFGFWSLNACKIVYTLDESNERGARFGFAYGTLSDHAERGEERFSVEFDAATQNVYYDILAFSRPARLLCLVGYPLSRAFQKKFGRESMQAMLRAVARAKT